MFPTRPQQNEYPGDELYADDTMGWNTLLLGRVWLVLSITTIGGEGLVLYSPMTDVSIHSHTAYWDE